MFVIVTIVNLSCSVYNMSKGGTQKISDTGLIGVSDEEIQRRLMMQVLQKQKNKVLKKNKRLEKIATFKVTSFWSHLLI